MIVKLLGGIQDGREIDMGASWPHGEHLPYTYEVPEIQTIQDRLQDDPSEPRMTVQHFQLHARGDGFVVYRHPSLKL